MTSVLDQKVGNDTDNYVSIGLLDLFSLVVAQVTVRIICGEKLGKDPEWVKVRAVLSCRIARKRLAKLL